MSQSKDSVVRAMTADGSFRVIAVTLDTTVQRIVTAQASDEGAALRLAELVAAAVLVREISAPDKRVQLTLRGREGGSLVAESRPDGACRGFVNPGNSESAEVSEVLFQVAYHRADGSLHQSTIQIPATASVAEALMMYLQTSAQIMATVGIRSCRQDGGMTATGYAAQLLPQADAGVVELVTSRLEANDPLEGRRATADLVAAVVGDLPTTPLAQSDLRFECTCSRERVMATLAGLPQTDLLEMVADQEPVAIHCDGCGNAYEISVAELSGMVTFPKK